MALSPCPFCASGFSWSQCSCNAALFAQRHGLMAARQQFALAAAPAPIPSTYRSAAAAVAPKPPPVAKKSAVSKAKAAAPKPRVGKKVPKPKAKKPAAPPNTQVLSPTGTKAKRAPAINPVEGACSYCDRRRTLNRANVKRHRERAPT